MCGASRNESRKLLDTMFLKLINDSSSLNKGNHDRDGVSISDLNSHRFLQFYFSVFFVILLLVEKIYQTLKTAFYHKHLEVHQKYSAIRVVFSTLSGVLKCDQTRSFVFDIIITSSFMAHISCS